MNECRVYHSFADSWFGDVRRNAHPAPPRPTKCTVLHYGQCSARQGPPRPAPPSKLEDAEQALTQDEVLLGSTSRQPRPAPRAEPRPLVPRTAHPSPAGLSIAWSGAA